MKSKNDDLVEAALEIQADMRRAYRLHEEHRPLATAVGRYRFPAARAAGLRSHGTNHVENDRLGARDRRSSRPPSPGGCRRPAQAGRDGVRHQVPDHNLQGLRMGCETRRAASRSPTISSFAGTH